jgi:succinate dehydrogenase / fumarate reductase iron-sulfur subunit
VTAVRTIGLTLKVWRQKNAQARGFFQKFVLRDLSTDMSFLEMLDIVNSQIEREGGDPVAFEHDCREGICGSCGAIVNGRAHGPDGGTALCQVHLRRFRDGETLYIEPFRAEAFPVIKDLVVDRSAFDRIVQAGGFISVRAGSAPEAHSIPVPKDNADKAFDAAACIGCGACVAACPNASAMLFVSAKVSHLNLLPHGAPEKYRRAVGMVRQMDAEGFGNCSNHYLCEAACPKNISVENIARLNRQVLAGTVRGGS